jgi:DNA-binding beta-propeller fold protein YncE
MRRCCCVLAVVIACGPIVRCVHAADRVVLVAGGSESEGGPAVRTRLNGPFGVDFDRSGDMLIVEIAGHRVLRVDRQGILTRIAGTGDKGDAGDGGPALRAQFNSMHSLAVAADGAIYVADTLNNRVRQIDPRTATIAAFAGTGEKGFSGDGGPAAQALFNGIYCVALDPAGARLYLTDLENRRIRVVDRRTGMVSTVAGNGQKGKPEDGADARRAPLVDPRAAAVDAQGNLYILERSGNALRVVDPHGRIRTVIGDGRGDTRLKGPKHLCVDRDGSVLIADTDNHRIVRYVPGEDRVLPVAGSGVKGSSGVPGPPDQVQLNEPHGVRVGPAGDLYIVDSMNHRVLRMERSAAEPAR